MKGGVKEGDYEGEGEVLAWNRRVPHILLANWSSFTSSTNAKTIPTCQQSADTRTEVERVWEGRNRRRGEREREREKECCNGVKGARE